MGKDEETKTMMVLISDGRANVGMGGKIKDELMEISEQSKRLGVHTIRHRYRGCGGLLHGHEARLLSGDSRECRRKILSSVRLEFGNLYNIVDSEQKLIFESNT